MKYFLLNKNKYEDKYETGFKIIFLFLIFLSSFQNTYSQWGPIPQYRLDVKNFTLVNPYRMTIDIVLTHTDNNLFDLAGHQYFLRVPQSIGTIAVGTGINSGYQYDSLYGQIITEIPSQVFLPRNPSVVGLVI